MHPLTPDLVAMEFVQPIPHYWWWWWSWSEHHSFVIHLELLIHIFHVFTISYFRKRDCHKIRKKRVSETFLHVHCIFIDSLCVVFLITITVDIQILLGSFKLHKKAIPFSTRLGVEFMHCIGKQNNVITVVYCSCLSKYQHLAPIKPVVQEEKNIFLYITI